MPTKNWGVALALAMLVATNLACNRQPPTSNNAKAGNPWQTKSTWPATRPLDFDYLTAVNDWLRRGVTPQNNASVLFWQAVGPAAIEADDRQRYFEMLGIAQPPDEGDYFVPLATFAERFDAGTDRQSSNTDTDTATPAEQLNLTTGVAWAKNQFPLIDAWLACNEGALMRMRETALRPRRYDPLILHVGHTLDSALLPALLMYRGCIQALVARANRSTTSGKVDEAWQDLLTAHRLCRLLTQGPSVFEIVTGTLTESVYVFDGHRLLLQKCKLSAEQARQMLRDLDTLPEARSLAEAVDQGERSMFGDWIGKIAQQQIGFRSLVNRDVPPGKLDQFEQEIADTIYWDRVLQMGNVWFDYIVEAYKMPSRRERLEAASDLRRGIDHLQAQMQTIAAAGKILTDPAHSSTENIGNACILALLPAVQGPEFDVDNAAMKLELIRTSLALAASRAEQGTYPQRLDDLVPQYLTEIPQDFFAKDPHAFLLYQRHGDGFLLWSIGQNNVDDHGVATIPDVDELHEGASDDIALQVPRVFPSNSE